MFSNNKHFETFRDKLKQAGYGLNCLWSANASAVSKYDDVALFAIYTDSAHKPSKVSTIIIRDYGKNGFGLWLESQSINIDADVAAIVGNMETLK